MRYHRVNHANLHGFLKRQSIFPRDTDRDLDYGPVCQLDLDWNPTPSFAESFRSDVRNMRCNTSQSSDNPRDISAIEGRPFAIL
jgi:hypothetical protein